MADRTNELNERLAWARKHPGSLLVIPPDDYQTDWALRFWDLIDVRVMMRDVVIWRTEGHWQERQRVMYLHLRSCKRLQILGGPEIQGAKKPEQDFARGHEPQHAFSIHACERVLIDQPRIRHVGGDAFYLGGRGRHLKYTPNRNIEIVVPHAEDMGRRPISALDVDGLAVRAGLFKTWHGTTPIDTERNHPESIAQNITISPETMFVNKKGKVVRPQVNEHGVKPGYVSPAKKG